MPSCAFKRPSQLILARMHHADGLSENVQVPRLHAMIVEPEVPQAAAQQQATAEQTGAQRAATLQLLTSVCGGDSLAAEYLLLQLISKCASRLPLFAHCFATRSHMLEAQLCLVMAGATRTSRFIVARHPHESVCVIQT